MSFTSPNDPVRLLRRYSPRRVLVIGGGLAGLFTALKLAPLPVTILSPRPLGEGASSAWAQGGIAAAIGEGDTAERHAADTIAAGAGLTNPTMAHLVAAEAAERIEDLLSYGVPFDRDLEGKLRLSREAAHSARRIVRVNGDQAGKAIMAALITAVGSTSSISVLENVRAVDLVSKRGRVIGVYARQSGTATHASFLGACAVVLATGGVGQLYRLTTNPKEANGSGLAMAARAGAVVADPEFVQFHPTAFDIGRDPAPLASEAIRGDGALLINGRGERFMLPVHAAAELAPRDVVARAVHSEIAQCRGAFLDCRALNLEKAFPAACQFCREAGIDPLTQPIPIAPAAHYHMGGVLTDARGRTSHSGLWACGEVACTGVHGANRLASNSLLEAVVFAARAAHDIEAQASQWPAVADEIKVEDHRDLSLEDAPTAPEAIELLRNVMTAQLGVTRSESSLRAALVALQGMLAGPLSAELKDMITCALFITVGALKRRESRGAHARTDYPRTLDGVPRHTHLTLTEVRAFAETVIATAGKQQRTGAAANSRTLAL
ncbi:MAG: L-aspartate oxidase [Rhodomicrobium sp.]